MTESTELDALMKFLRDAQQDLAKKDLEGLEISLSQALGRAKNLQTLFKENFFVIRKSDP